MAPTCIQSTVRVGPVAYPAMQAVSAGTDGTQADRHPVRVVALITSIRATQILVTRDMTRLRWREGTVA